ncbi:MAG: nucleoside-diphosphate sugar epimerase/dehydratase [bacterium]|nr:nucleoside-diphosphate sugar epimerase/dehydratase [bacterium]
MPRFRIFQKFLAPSNLKRLIFFVVTDALLISLSFFLAFYVRFDFSLAFYSVYRSAIWHLLPFFVVVKLILFGILSIYQLTWRYVSLRDIYRVALTLFLAELSLMGVVYFIVIPTAIALPFQLPAVEGFPRSILFIDGVISFLMIGGLRISKRFYLEAVRGRRRGSGKRTIIIGAGNTGEMIVRDLMRQVETGFQVVGFLDDDRNKIGIQVHGIEVLGNTRLIKSVISQYCVEVVILAIPSLDHRTLKCLYAAVKSAGVKIIKIVPRIYDVHEIQHLSINTLEDIKVEDLLGRQIVELAYKEIEEFIIGKVVLITGAGGSIGAEIVKQIYAFHPEQIILYEIDETALHKMQLALKSAAPHSYERAVFVVGDVRDSDRVGEVFERYRPEIIFHAAAYKHVPMMEHNASEAVKANIMGTYNVAKAAVSYGAKKFVMISTDKAVHPSSVMGATKRCAEDLCRALTGVTEFVSVRFGNVLGSRGSVLPLFLEQLKAGGPLTVTHPDMKRYFMTIPEAVSLVLQASVIGCGGDVMVLDMGEPVRIVELAEEIIRLHGLRPHEDIAIEFVGLRPGEKLFEEILSAEDGTVSTRHAKIFVAKPQKSLAIDEMETMIDRWSIAVRVADPDGHAVRQLLYQYVNRYQGNSSPISTTNTDTTESPHLIFRSQIGTLGQ